ncbi:LysR substrate-binding domain-containing protein [Caballeronia sp. SEWSISQ10-4 2]|uniref:LysR substrate-binding domain-containing protein n=1 Tax=Caballeronia sp. SEWSISQ10-4 2 TaxID=2937438 RepID=UPI00264D9ED8|nr:LysR substrate-binding domain-containing protein [Caballeronia sp. SEWSISQ10-4 2]MDN7179172.1 LysR substrate-binding domain-containing protein [Caballeronia sp. SEWSISQ10-4 2]
MKRTCPTIQELLAFDAVARHESLTRAAMSLCISVSAVSKQISALESYLGRPLLQKYGRGVQLTTAGLEYLARVSPSLRTLEAATFEFRAGRTGAGLISLACVPTFLTKWLIPRLIDFRRLHAGVTFSFSQHLAETDSPSADMDAAIRYGAGDWPRVRSDYIAGKEFVCVYSPLIAPKGRLLRSAADVAGETLLHHDQAPLAWRHWAQDHSIDEALTLAGPRFVQYSAIIQAAISGLGLALVPKILVEEELTQRVLLTLGQPLELEHGHYLCFDNARLDRPAFAAFRSWILAQGQMQSRGPL